MQPDAAVAGDRRYLGYGEHLLVWGFWAMGLQPHRQRVRPAYSPMTDMARNGIELFAGEVDARGAS